MSHSELAVLRNEGRKCGNCAHKLDLKPPANDRWCWCDKFSFATEVANICPDHKTESDKE